MAHNPRPGPLPEGHAKTNNPIKMFRSFARVDPQLYPLAAIMIGTLSIAGYFIYGRTEQIPRTPNKIDRSPGKPPASGNSGSDTGGGSG